MNKSSNTGLQLIGIPYGDYLEYIKKLLDRLQEIVNDPELTLLDLYLTPRGVEGNSIAKLVAHTTGALTYGLNDILQGKETGRDRNWELYGIMPGELSKDDLVTRIVNASNQVLPALEFLIEAEKNGLDIKREDRNGKTVTGPQILLSRYSHTAEHLGQAQSIRDELKERFVEIYEDNIRRPIKEMIGLIRDLPQELLDWKPPGEKTNSLGIIFAHVAGSLNAGYNYIGKGIQGIPEYNRDRESEFKTEGVPADELVRRLEAAVYSAETALKGQTRDLFKKDLPLIQGKLHRTVEGQLLYLFSHVLAHLKEAKQVYKMLPVNK